jgi:hypothetical protein
MRLLPSLFLGAFLLLICGCSAVPFADTRLVPAIPASAGELTSELWQSGQGTVLIRQSALFEFHGMRVPLVGIMKLDLAKKSARLVGMNDMGVKFYDLSVERNSSTAHFVIPELARYPGFAEAVATSVRRIFLDPEPEPDDSFITASDTYRFCRTKDGQAIRFVIGGADRQLLEKTSSGARESWRVRYYQYQRFEGNLLPAGVVLDDDKADYRLTLWIESVEKSDE